jgi:hypothetical protein
VRRSQFATAYGEGATLDAEAAGARWEPEPEPAAELTRAELDAIGSAAIGAWHAADPGPDKPLAAGRAAVAKLRELSPRQQPAGPGRERKLAVPLRLIPSAWPTCRVEDAARRNILDVSTYKPGEINEPDESWTETDRATLVELVDHYNAPPAPAGWSPPRLGRKGLPPASFVHLWDGEDWVPVQPHEVEDDDRWLPQPPPPPEAP